MDKVPIGIIGLGGIAQTIHLPILTKLPEVEIVAVCDIDRQKAQSIARKYNIKRSYNDYETMLKDEENLIGVDVCVSTNAQRKLQ